MAKIMYVSLMADGRYMVAYESGVKRTYTKEKLPKTAAVFIEEPVITETEVEPEKEPEREPEREPEKEPEKEPSNEPVRAPRRAPKEEPVQMAKEDGEGRENGPESVYRALRRYCPALYWSGYTVWAGLALVLALALVTWGGITTAAPYVWGAMKTGYRVARAGYRVVKTAAGVMVAGAQVATYHLVGIAVVVALVTVKMAGMLQEICVDGWKMRKEIVEESR